MIDLCLPIEHDCLVHLPRDRPCKAETSPERCAGCKLDRVRCPVPGCGKFIVAERRRVTKHLQTHRTLTDCERSDIRSLMLPRPAPGDYGEMVLEYDRLVKEGVILAH